jgi:EAL domain-containing protein (putative c-di-GMP-specific phosphodiesterase class I)
VLDAIQLLARELDAQVVAEGVEEPEDLAALRELGVGGAQGFLLARPLSAADLRARCVEATRSGR